MSNIILEAELREHAGKSASRRLRRLEQKIPAILYGGEHPAQSVQLPQNKVCKALETEAIYSSVFTLKIGKKNEHVILKDIQRHPYKPIILHIDFQRVSNKEVIVKHVPIHFINEQASKGVKDGGIISHSITQIEIRCQAKDLPEYIEVDMRHVGLNEGVHLADLKLPKGVALTIDVTDPSHNLGVVNIHPPRVDTAEKVEKEVVPSADDVTLTVEGEQPHAKKENDAS